MAARIQVGGRRGAAARAMAYGTLACLLVLTSPGGAARATAALETGAAFSAAAAAAAPAPAEPAPGVRVVLEHLIIRPVPGRPGSGFEVLDLLRLDISEDDVGPEGPVFSVPLPPGHEGLQVLSGLRRAAQAVGGRQVRGLLEQPRGQLLTVAVRYRLPASRFPDTWVLARPYPVETTVVLLHPDAAVAVAGALAAGELNVDGTPYRAYVSRAAGGTGTVVLAPLVRPRTGLDGIALLPVVALAGAVAVTWQVVRLRRRAARRGQGQGGREVERLVERMLDSDGEFAAGYLEESRYRQLREATLSRLAHHLESTGRAGGGRR